MFAYIFRDLTTYNIQEVCFLSSNGTRRLRANFFHLPILEPREFFIKSSLVVNGLPRDNHIIVEEKSNDFSWLCRSGRYLANLPPETRAKQ